MDVSERSVLLHAVGDIALGDHPLGAGFGAHSSFRFRPPDFPFSHVAPCLRQADIAFGNLECTLSERGLRPRNYRSMQMRGQPSYAAALRNAGFGVLSVANNHSMQHGTEAFLDTVDMLRSAGIGVCGLAGPSFRTAVPEVIVRNGLKIAFLGWSLRPRQYFAAGPLYAEGHAGTMLRDVRQARKTHDCVVVSLHWGDEFIASPSPAEIELSHHIMSAGADLIIGHHPHVLRGCERYGRGWIIYSLGNFLGDMIWSDRLRESAIVSCRLTPDGVEGVKFLPVRIADDYRPVLLDGENAEVVSRRLAALSEDIARQSAALVSEEGSARYRVAAERALAEERKRSRLHFLRRAYRMPLGILVQQACSFVRNRIAERG